MVMTLSRSVVPSRSLPEVDIELFTFVERYATNLVRMDLLMYFGRNPDEKITAGDLARAVHRTLRATKKELDDLTYLHILARHYTQEKATYQLTRRGAARRSVIRLAEYGKTEKSEDGEET